MDDELKSILADIQRDITDIKNALGVKERIERFRKWCTGNANLSSADIICTLVCERFSSAAFRINVAALKGKGRPAQLSLVRHTAMKLVNELTDMSLEEIGEFFGGRDHTTVTYAVARIKRRLKDEDRFRIKYNSVKDECRSTILQSGS